MSIAFEKANRVKTPYKIKECKDMVIIKRCIQIDYSKTERELNQ